MKVEDLHVSIEGNEILKGVSFNVKPGEVVVIMGPNGSGKSTLANSLMGHPGYDVSGKIMIDGDQINSLNPNERAKKGLFLSFQYPVSISGVTMTSFLRMAYNEVKDEKLSVVNFHKMMKDKMELLGMDSSFGRRYLNEGFSGGEKKKAEILQMLVLEPRYPILDETDSGLDVDALKTVAEGINAVRSSDRGILLITHYNRILKYVKPDKILVLVDGKIVASDGPELAGQIEEEGYHKWTGKK